MSPRSGAFVQIDGRGFDTDPAQISWQTQPVGRDGVDQGAGPGEQSLSNGVVWRRSREDFIEGAGQTNADLLDNESSRLRYFESVGVDTWTRREAKLLHDTELKIAGAGGSHPPRLCVATATDGTVWVFYIDSSGTAYKTSNLDAASPTFVPITGLLGGATQMTTDGSRVWFGSGLSNVYYCDAGDTVATWSGVVGSVDQLGYANGRLLASYQERLLELDASGANTLIFTHPSAAFRWDGIVESPAGIYCFGHVGDKSQVFVLTAIDATGALDVPFHATSLPDGERLLAMQFYLGVMIMGTSLGIRLATITGGGFLSFGPAIDEPGPVSCFEPQGDDVWFGWNDLTGSEGGLGRVRLSRFTSELVPAFTTDLVASGSTGDVSSVITFDGKRYFAMDDDGVYGEVDTYVPFGYLDFGWFTYGISEQKAIDTATVWTDALPAATSVRLIVYPDDSATPVIDGLDLVDGDRMFTLAPTAQVAAERLHAIVELNTTDPAVTPTLKRINVRVAPLPFISQAITLPLFLSSQVDGEGGGKYELDVWEEWQILQDLLLDKTRFPLSVGKWTGTARLEALEVQPGGLGGDNGITGFDKQRAFLSGRWMATFFTLEPAANG